jgi:hypothetical protein
MVAFLTPQDLRDDPMGLDLSLYADDEEGDLQLSNLLTRSLRMIGGYLPIEADITFHQVRDEEHEVLGSNLPFFPRHAPIRGVQSLNILYWATQGQRQVFTLPTTQVENVPAGWNPLIFGNVKVTRDIGYAEITSYAGALGFPWVGIAQVESIYATYTAGYDVPGPMRIFNSTVASDPTPSTTVFSLAPGDGSRVLQNVVMASDVGSSKVLSVSGDLVTLATPLDAPPDVGSSVHQGDGVRLEPPGWLVETQRALIRHLVNLTLASSNGVGFGTVRMGMVEFRTPKSGDQMTIPDEIKADLDEKFGAFGLSMA